MGEINLLGTMCKFLLARGWNFSLKVKSHRMIIFGLFAMSLLFIVQVVNSPPEDKLIVSPMFYQTSNLFILYCLLPLFIVDSVY